ncbi:hypothetical protein QN277_008747 [Acacia crassicarpa]|uniref:RING-type E3 ubiquitin transferase n=1 Tax=Acacia crassicarpa TaxID=499986 RepID=A0AAE1IS96_9FABA|nr:hypothetical protein QN277_008747 [Acacia crassicarpa]
MNTVIFILIFLSTFFSSNFLTSASTPSPYKSRCASIVPASVPVKLKPSSFPLPQLHTGYFKGGEKILQTSFSWLQNGFSLQTNKVHQTQTSGLFKVEASLKFISNNDRYYSSRSKVIVFKLDGFWSESSGRLCMVGKGKGYSKDGDFLHDLDAVFTLSNLFNSSNVTSLIHGSLSSADDVHQDRYFEPIYVLMLPQKNYKYSLDSREVEHDFAYHENDADEGLPLDPSSFCSHQISGAIRWLYLDHPIDCHLNSVKNKNPIGGVNESSCGSMISMDEIECSSSTTDKPRFRVLVRFPYDDYYYYGFESVNVTRQTPMFVGEGWWDETKNQIQIVACNFMGVKDDSSSSLSGAHVGDCSIRLRLKFPSVLSIKNTSRIVGQIWSNKTQKDLVNFNDGFGNSRVVLHGLKYEYTQLEKVKKFCPTRHNQVKNQENRYPAAYSHYMRTQSSVREYKKRIGWADSSPLAVGDEIYRDPFVIFDSATATSVSQPYEGITSNNTLFNVSFTMTLYSNSMLEDKKSLFNKSSKQARISAEGTYDAETGILCMVGCRNLVLNFSSGTPKGEDSPDCEMLIKFEFPPLDAARRRSHIKGSIESTRKSSDPLYFKVLNLTSYAYYTQREDTTWRMDVETIMVLVSTILASAFLVSQLIHLKRNPKVLPLISLTMVSILTLGHMVPLVLNFEAVFAQNRYNRNFVFRNVGMLRLEVNETTVRLSTMVVFLLLLRFLWVSWSARKADEKSHKGLWVAEKKTACVILPLYALCFLIALLLQSKNNYEESSFQRHSSWEGLKELGGLVLDGFLLPQIMFNLFSNMKENALSSWFYFGTSFVRMLPHAYDLYRAHIYDGQDDDNGFYYYYADPSADYYSTTWDIVIPLGSLMFAVIILLQQRFGGCCVVPRRFRSSHEGYQKVPMVTIPEEEGEKEKEREETV